MSTKTHWRKLFNPEYLGAYSLDPGKDLIVTIKSVGQENVTGPDGKKEECTVAHFEEHGIKPMILNSTNSKMITKIHKTPYIEEWRGRQIQLYADKVRAFGEIVEALRVRNFVPKKVSTDKNEPILCSSCGVEIKPFGKMDAVGMADYTHKKYGRELCAECAQTEAAKADPLGAEKEEANADN